MIKLGEEFLTGIRSRNGMYSEYFIDPTDSEIRDVKKVAGGVRGVIDYSTGQMIIWPVCILHKVAEQALKSKGYSIDPRQWVHFSWSGDSWDFDVNTNSDPHDRLLRIYQSRKDLSRIGSLDKLITVWNTPRKVIGDYHGLPELDAAFDLSTYDF